MRNTAPKTALKSALLLAGIALLGACTSEPTAAGSTTNVRPAAASASGEALGAATLRDLATLRRATAPFHNFEKAVAAGWSVQITGCMADPTAGGMGYHYGNVALIDGVARVDQPELLLYEPQQNGRLRLVGVEYIIPYTFHARAAAPPVLFGQEFHRVDAFQLWGLHAWVWDHNPSGMFASWNPRVTCANATDLSAMVHH